MLMSNPNSEFLGEVITEDEMLNALNRSGFLMEARIREALIKGDLKVLSAAEPQAKPVDIDHVRYEYQTVGQQGRKHYQIDVICEAYLDDFLKLISQEAEYFIAKLKENLNILSSTAQSFRPLMTFNEIAKRQG